MKLQANQGLKSVPLLDVNRGNQPLLQDIVGELTAICESGRFIGGPHCAELERSVAEFCETEFAVGCASGSDALLLGLMAIDLQPGDEVLVPSFTFFASVSAITRLGGKPVFVDIDPQTFNLDPNHAEQLITGRTRAIMPVHLFGQCVDMDAVQDLAARHGLRVIEDAAQAIGASFNERRACSFGDLGCISFYPTKNLGGFGDAGMIATNDAQLANRVRLLSNHGMKPRYYHSEIGVNSRLDAMQAAVLNIKLQHLKRYNAMRTRNAQLYRRLMASKGLQGLIGMPMADRRCGHVWNQFTIRIPGGHRDKVRQFLTERGIGSEIYYPVPVHRQACFHGLGYGTGSLPETERAASEVLSLPIFPELSDAEIEFVVDGLADAVMGQQQLRMAS